MSTWNYRIVNHGKDGFALHEVYYDDEGKRIPCPRFGGVTAFIIPPDAGACVMVVLDQPRQDMHPTQQPLGHVQVRLGPVGDDGRGGPC